MKHLPHITSPVKKNWVWTGEKTNVNGSGISLGHPVGCTGARLIVTLYYELERQGLNLGVAGLCAGGGVGTAVMLERC